MPHHSIVIFTGSDHPVVLRRLVYSGYMEPVFGLSMEKIEKSDRKTQQGILGTIYAQKQLSQKRSF
jgi:hypothetical protein